MHLKFCIIYTKGNNFCDSVIASLDNIAFPKGSTQKGKNLLLEEQILFPRR